MTNVLLSEKIFGKLRAIENVMVSRGVGSVKGVLLGNKINAYWYAGMFNFGDLLTPLLLRYYGFTPIHVSIKRAKLLSTGSILQAAPKDYVGHILGSGLIRDAKCNFRRATIWAVRGDLTRQRIGARTTVVLGDPGLLASKLIKQRRAKRYTLGVVPHYVDKQDPRVLGLQRKYKKEVLVIDVARHPSAVFSDIDQCEFILSSSLHGLVIADSLGVPNVWIRLSKGVTGYGFKFHDYGTAIERKLCPLSFSGNESLAELIKGCCSHSRDAIEAVKQKLDCTFQSFKQYCDSE